MNYFRRIREAFIAVVLLTLPFFFLRSNLRAPEEINVFDRVLLQVSAPIQYLATQVAKVCSSVLEEYFYLVEVKQESKNLAQENQTLRDENLKLRLVEEENKRLRDLLQLQKKMKAEQLSAQVIGKEVSSLFRVVRIRLDRGERDRVKEGMPVISSGGLVGHIRRTKSRYSDVSLIVDQASAIDVVIGRNKARGILEGTGELDQHRCKVQYLKRTDTVEIGDEVYTSGFGKRFPASILAGHVSKVNKQEFGLYQEIEVTPSVNFSALNEVFVLTSSPKNTWMK